MLVICPSWVGDTVMATPALRALRVLRPAARLVAAVRPGIETLLAGCPFIDEFVAVETKALAGPWRLARRARAAAGGPIDAALVLPNSFRSALAARLAGARRRIGYDRSARRFLLNDALDPGPRNQPVPAVEYYSNLAEHALGGGPIERRLELAITTGEREGASRILTGVARPFVLLNPGANRADKRWPAERFGAVAARLAGELGLAAAVSGTPAEASIAAAVVAAAAQRGTAVADLAGRAGLDLGTLKAIIAEAALLVTNDTGPRHIAGALGTPAVALFGPTDHRWTTLPGVAERRLLAEPFLPETFVADRHAAFCAIDRIGVGDVVFAAAQLLRSPT